MFIPSICGSTMGDPHVPRQITAPDINLYKIIIIQD